MAYDDVKMTCGKCGCEWAMPRELYVSAKRSPRISFWCPYGHERHFPAGETAEDKLRRERDRLVQQLAQKNDEIAFQRDIRQQTERRLSATKGQVTKLKNRAAAGVCPCCNRHFENLHRHMANQHPKFLDEKPDDNVVPIKKETA